MLTTFITTLWQMLSLMLVLIIGYILNKLKVIPKSGESVMSKLITNVFLPALTMYTFLTECTPENLRTYGMLPLYGLAVFLTSMGIGYLLGKPFGRGNSYLEGIYRYLFTHPNTGGIGTPLVLAMFGTAGYFRFSLFLLSGTAICYTWGVQQITPKSAGHRGWKVLFSLINPIFIAMLIGAILGLCGVGSLLPPVIPDMLQKIGGCYTIVSLILCGYVIADFDIKTLLNDPKVYLFTALRLLILPLIYLGAAKLLNLSELLCTMICLTVACPAGMNTVVYPVAYGEDTRPGASILLVSTVFSVLTVPFLYALI